jgi:hypothetical protein
MYEFIITPLAILLSLCTSTGVLLHETKMDKVASLALSSMPTANTYVSENSSTKLEGTPHTHVERTSLESASRELHGKNPHISPRREDKKYRLQKKVTRGFHVFDSYHLPLDLTDNSQLGF